MVVDFERAATCARRRLCLRSFSFAWRDKRVDAEVEVEVADVMDAVEDVRERDVGGETEDEENGDVGAVWSLSLSSMMLLELFGCWRSEVELDDASFSSGGGVVATTEEEIEAGAITL